MQRRKTTLLFALLLINFSLFAQKVDRLSDKDNQYLVDKLNSFQFNRNDTLAWIYINAYIQNAKNKNDFETQFYGYRHAIYHANGKQKLIYSDSALMVAKKTENDNLIGKAYYTRGSAYYELREYKNTLDNYLKAHAILADSKDEFTKNQIKYGISVVKLYLGYHEDALKLIESPLEYFKNLNSPDANLFYIRCLYRKGEAYQAMKNFEKASEINLLGLQEAIKFKEKIQEQYFNLAIGIDDYHSGNYALAIQNILKALPTMQKNGYFEMEEKGHYYLAKSYLALNQEEKSLFHLEQVDSLFVKYKYLPNELRESYEILIDYYKSHNDKDKQLYYINQLLEIDNSNSTNNKYLAYKINKEYDTHRLLEEKRNIEQKFSQWQYYAVIFLFALLLTSIFYFYKYRKYQFLNRSLQTQFEALLKESENAKFSTSTKPKKTIKEIPADVVESILTRLTQFEEKQEFLDKNIDLRSLAEKFKTNTTYLSKVINTYKQINFTGYLNKLRINYIIELLKKEPKYRNYTLEALAETAGFANARQFSDIFYNETGLRPTYFLEQIRKKEKIVS